MIIHDMTKDFNQTRQAATRAADLLKKGGVVVFPTETVYGIAADPRKKDALRLIYRMKGRSRDKSMTLQVGTVDRALRLVRKNKVFEKTARHFWPGPLAIVAWSRKKRKKIGIRVPRHRFVLELLNEFRRPLAVTSANRSGQASLRFKDELLKFVDRKVDMLIFEKSSKNRASTVLDLTGKRPVVLRVGAVTLKELARVIRA